MEQFFNVRRYETIFEDHVGVWLPELKALWAWAIKDSVMLIRLPLSKPAKYPSIETLGRLRRPVSALGGDQQGPLIANASLFANRLCRLGAPTRSFPARL